MKRTVRITIAKKNEKIIVKKGENTKIIVTSAGRDNSNNLTDGGVDHQDTPLSVRGIGHRVDLELVPKVSNEIESNVTDDNYSADHGETTTNSVDEQTDELEAGSEINVVDDSCSADHVETTLNSDDEQQDELEASKYEKGSKEHEKSKYSKDVGTKGEICVRDVEKTYTVTVYTGDVMYAGTDAKVFLKCYGDKATTKQISLKKSSKYNDPFEKGHTDVFQFKTHRDLGYIHKIAISHDNTGIFPGWFLNKVIIQDKETEKKYAFHLNDWLFKGKDSSLRVEIDVEFIPIIAVIPCTEENAEDHHTNKFILIENPSACLLRRGDSFYVDVQFARKYNASNDEWDFVFKTGFQPREKNGTLVTVEKHSPKEFKKIIAEGEHWGYKVAEVSENKKVVTIEIFIAPNAIPGIYQMTIETDEGVIYKSDELFVILFNPWCKNDEVYIESDVERQEYVLRQHGQIFRGTEKHPLPCQWYFGQYEEVTLFCALKLLEGEKVSKRGSAVTVVRLISSRANSNDNMGVLEGRWDGEYSDGHEPTYWNSSPAIFECYRKEKRPVKYGQCWVFSAITTSLLRALGIPCRSITNFGSSHDTDGNCSYDIYFDRHGKYMKEKSTDSVWNFHCWNEAWMVRKDLPPGYGGWQVVDSTPQERSNGIFQLGPCSVVAVKEGETQHRYDARFVFAEVNADTLYWKENENGIFEVVKTDRFIVGKMVCTKAVGRKQLEEITYTYKHQDGSALDKTVVRNAVRSRKVIEQHQEVLVMRLVKSKEFIHVGEDLHVKLHLENKVQESRTVDVFWKVDVVRYDGVHLVTLEQSQTHGVVVQGFNVKEHDIKIHATKSYSHLSEEVMYRVQATGNIREEKQLVFQDEIVAIRFPELQFHDLPKSKVKSRRPLTFTVVFQNTLDIALTGCQMQVDGSIIKNRHTVKNIQTIQPKQTFRHDITIVPDLLGTKQSRMKSIAVSFFCKQMGGLSGMQKIAVIDE